MSDMMDNDVWDENCTNLISVGPTDFNHTDRCFVCYTVSPGSRLCAQCWNKYSSDCWDAVEDGIFSVGSDIRSHSIGFVDIHRYMSQINGWPIDERVANILKYGPVRKWRDE